MTANLAPSDPTENTCVYCWNGNQFTELLPGNVCVPSALNIPGVKTRYSLVFLQLIKYERKEIDKGRKIREFGSSFWRWRCNCERQEQYDIQVSKFNFIVVKPIFQVQYWHSFSWSFSTDFLSDKLIYVVLCFDYSSVSSSNRPNKLEAEVQKLSLSWKSENVIRETVRCLQGDVSNGY
jgi:hypothetical protein